MTDSQHRDMQHKLDDIRQLCRTMDALLAEAVIIAPGLSEVAADLLEAAKSSNSATRTLLMHASRAGRQAAAGARARAGE